MDISLSLKNIIVFILAITPMLTHTLPINALIKRPLPLVGHFFLTRRDNPRQKYTPQFAHNTQHKHNSPIQAIFIVDNKAPNRFHYKYGKTEDTYQHLHAEIGFGLIVQGAYDAECDG